MDAEIHPIQAKILTALLFTPVARFGELNSELTNDHFTFHIKRLVEVGLVEKYGGKYRLTAKGKEFANRLDTETARIERQPKTTVLVVGARKEGKKIEYLIQQRLKQPYYGFYGFVSGKTRWGESVREAAARELVEETGLTGVPKLIGIEHKLDVKDGLVQEDKYFYVCRVDSPEGKLMTKFEGGRNLWLTEKEIDGLDKLFGDVRDILGLVKQKRLGFLEKKFVISEY